MTKLQVFLRVQFIPFISLIISLSLSFFNFYSGYDSWNGNTYEATYIMWSAVYPRWYMTINIGDQIVSWNHFSWILLSLILFIRSTIIAKKYLGFPSIKDAKHYFKELKRVKRASLNAKAKAEFKIKMEKLEEEKKKYL
jgi:hypothetical protein